MRLRWNSSTIFNIVVRGPAFKFAVAMPFDLGLARE